MNTTLRTMREKRADGERGFTLIELLVVVVIIGVLVAIAVPLYLNYRKGAENKSAQSDIRGAISAVEQYYTENGNTYPATLAGAQGASLVFAAQAGGTAQTATVSAGNTLSYVKSGTGYWICGQNVNGQAVYVYNSSVGGPVKIATGTMANCVAVGS